MGSFMGFAVFFLWVFMGSFMGFMIFFSRVFWGMFFPLKGFLFEKWFLKQTNLRKDDKKCPRSCFTRCLFLKHSKSVLGGLCFLHSKNC